MKKQYAVCDRIAAARAYQIYLEAGRAEGEFKNKIRAPTSEADFVRNAMFSGTQRATADAVHKARQHLEQGIIKGVGHR